MPNVVKPTKIYKRSLGRHVATIIKMPENRIIIEREKYITLPEFQHNCVKESLIIQQTEII